MTETPSHPHPKTVAVIGAGPAGLYATRTLAQAGIHVLLINRDLKPGGLAEYGIYHTKHKMKEGLRKQFRKIMEMPQVSYWGGIQVGNAHHITLQDLYNLGCSAILFTIGAQGTKNLGLPGEEARGVFHAKDLVYHYNQLPPFADRSFAIGQHVGIIGMGNVMVDIAHWLICDKKVEQVTVIARRGPAERAYTDKEMREIIGALDQNDLKAEFARIQSDLEGVGQDPETLYQEIIQPLEKAEPIDSPTRFCFRFLCSPLRVHTQEQGHINGLEIEYNQLVRKGESIRPQGTGQTAILPMDTLIYAIGDQVDASVGLPFQKGQYTVDPSPHPQHPERARYHVYDPATQQIVEGVFVGGWARQASDGLVGKARADGEIAAEEVLSYVAQRPAPTRSPQQLRDTFTQLLQGKDLISFTYAHVQQLESLEQAQARHLGREFFKFNSNQEMLDALQANPQPSP